MHYCTLLLVYVDYIDFYVKTEKSLAKQGKYEVGVASADILVVHYYFYTIKRVSLAMSADASTMIFRPLWSSCIN
jgi:hypothetical protein